MRFYLPHFDGRSAANTYPIVEVDTDKVVGLISTGQGWIIPGAKRWPSRTISFFDGKYMGEFETHKECEAFAKGVEAVLNHMISTKDMTSANEFSYRSLLTSDQEAEINRLRFPSRSE
jgi:hypothetical protein